MGVELIALTIGLFVACISTAVSCAATTTRTPTTQPATSRPATTYPAGTLAISIASGQRWPNDLVVKITGDPAQGAPIPRKYVRILSVTEAHLAAARKMQSDGQLRRRAKAGTPSTRKRFEDALDPDGCIWVVVTQEEVVKPLKRINFSIVAPGDAGEINDDRPIHFDSRIRRDIFLPGTISVYAIWTELGVEIARSASVQVEVEDGS